MTSREWNTLYVKLQRLRSIMSTGENYEYAPNCMINASGVDGWIKDAGQGHPCRGMMPWPRLMQDLNLVYKLIKDGK